MPETALVPYQRSALEDLLEQMRYDYRKYADMRDEIAKNPTDAQLRTVALYRMLMWGCVLIVLASTVFSMYRAYAWDAEQAEAKLAGKRVTDVPSSMGNMIVILGVFFGPVWVGLGNAFRKAANTHAAPIEMSSNVQDFPVQFPDQEPVLITISYSVPTRYERTEWYPLQTETRIALQHHFDMLAALPNLSPEWHYRRINAIAIDHILSPVLFEYARKRRLPILHWRTIKVTFPTSKKPKLEPAIDDLRGVIIGSLA